MKPSIVFTFSYLLLACASPSGNDSGGTTTDASEDTTSSGEAESSGGATGGPCGGTDSTGNTDSNGHSDSNGETASGGGHDVDPMRIPGGGVASPPIDGELNVFVVMEQTDTPMAGVTVCLGDMEGVTDGEGLVVFHDAALQGPQTVTASLPGYAVATWVGVAGANLTMTLSTSNVAPPTAHASGTLSLPAPAALSVDEYYVGLVFYSHTPLLGAPENVIEQPTAMDGTPLNVCVRSALSPPDYMCNWQLTSRVGRQAHYAVIAKGNIAGTPNDTTDDTYELVGYGIKTGLDLQDGDDISNETFDMLDMSAAVDVTVSFAEAPMGVPERLALPYLDLGEDGHLVIPVPSLKPTTSTTKVPALQGPFASGSYHVVSFANVSATQPVPYSVTLVRNIDLALPVTLPEWLPPPSGLARNGNGFTFIETTGTSLRVAIFLNTQKQRLWIVTLLDGSMTFSLPERVNDVLGSGDVEYHVLAVEILNFDPLDFSLLGFQSKMTRLAEHHTLLTP